MSFLLLNLVIALFFTSATTFIVGIFVLIKSWQNKTNRIFALYSFSISWWSFFDALLVSSNDYDLAFMYARIMNFGIYLIPVFFVHFLISFLGVKRKKVILAVIYIFGVSFSILSLFKLPVFLSGVRVVSFVNYYTDIGLVGHFAFGFFCVCVIFSLFELFRAYIKSDKVKHNQLAYLLWPSLLGYIGGGANWFFVYDIYVPVLMPFGTYFVGFYAVSVAYAILKYQLMDIKIVIKKAFFYSIGIALASGLIVSISFLSNWFSERIPGFKGWTVPVIAGTTAFIVGRIFWNKSKEVDKLKYEFITVAAHKLRTPLTEIKWAAAALADKGTKEEDKKKLVAEITNADSKLIELTNELLSVSGVEANQRKYNLEPINLEKVARSVINSFQFQIKEKNIKLKYNFEKNLPNVNMDKVRIGSVIQILMENALTYTKDEIKISIDVYKNKVIFHIEDNGIGIKKEDQEYIFSKFYRSHEAYLTETEGTGIGLFLAKSIIDRHGGKIGVRSSGSGKGSIFWFSLPVAG